MKNSSYQLAKNLIFKFGSLLFTIVIARMLLPERMGLYNLALATIVLFSSFSDLGISSALITFGSKMLGNKNPEKAKGYFKKLLKWKLQLVFLISVILLASSYFISNLYYHKPIFYALLAGGLYLPIVSLIGFVEQSFRIDNNFKIPLFKEIIFQSSRFIIVPLAILIFLKSGLSNSKIIFVSIMALTITYLISLLFLIICANRKLRFLKIKSDNLSKVEMHELKKFILPLSATAMAGMFFGYIDTLMLGRFVSSKFIAYYGAAFSLVGAASGIIGFMSVALLPIFAKKSGKALENIFKKARGLTLIISILAGIFTYLVSWYLVRIAYGADYLQAVPILRWFSIIVILIPVIGIYVGYYTTQKKTKALAWLILGSAILNIILNYFGIIYGLENYGEMGAVFGAVGATITSRTLYLVGLIIFRKKY